MKLSTPIRTFNTYGGGSTFEPVAALLELSDQKFGEALQEIELTLCFQSERSFSEQNVDETLQQSYDEFHRRHCVRLPIRRYVRKKATLKLEVLATFASAEQVEQPTQGMFNLAWQSEVLELLLAEVEACRKKFKASDHVRVADFLDWLRLQHQNLPKTQEEAQALTNRLEQHEEELQRQLSEWDRLGIDWSDYHPDAREMIPDPRLWSSGHEFAPNGNDNGADLLASFRSQKSRWARDGGQMFYRNLARDWGFNPEATPGETIDYLITRQSILGLAFAFLKLFASCPQWLAERAMQEIHSYQAYLETHHRDWEHREECLSYHASMLECLHQCPRS